MIRANVQTLKPYKPILPFEVLSRQLGREPHEIIKIDANENPYGPSPLVGERLAEAPYLHIYPDPASGELREALADYTGISADYLLAGHGADELIDLLLRLVIEPGESIINCPPTFGMYAFDAAINAAEVINVPRRADFSLDLAGIEAQFAEPPYPKLLFVTSPNNPSGNVMSDESLRTLLAMPTLVVLDEAYIEFTNNPRIEWVRDYDNLVVIRTFSKWAGLAGLRVGYGAFPLDLLTHLWKIKQPYNVNVAGQIAALASLHDQARLLDNVQKIIQTRQQFEQDLAQIDWLQPYPTHTNYVLCRVVVRDAAVIKQQLAEAGILVRYYNSPGLTDHLRFSIGLPEQMVQVIETLKRL